MKTEEWAQMTPEEVREVKDKARCRSCKYHGVFSGGEVFCDYLAMEKKRRGCTVDECRLAGGKGAPPKHKVQPHAMTKTMRRRPYRSIVKRAVKPDVNVQEQNKSVSEWMMEGVSAQGISLRMLCKKIGVSTTTIYNWRDGTVRPSNANLRKLAAELKIDINDKRLEKR